MYRLSIALTRAEQMSVKDGEISDHKTARGLIEATLAMEIAYRLPLPSSPVTDPRFHFVENFYGNAEETLGKINEHFTIDIDTALKLVEGTWMVRYRIVHDPLSDVASTAMIAANAGSRYHIPGLHREAIKQADPRLIRDIRTEIRDDMNLVLPVPE